jgi:hypothetical protein
VHRGAIVIDPRREAILIDDPIERRFVDKTFDVDRYRTRADGRTIEIIFRSGTKVYRYGRERVRILRGGESVPVPEGSKVEVLGVLWPNATDAITFTGPDGAWLRIFYSRKDGVERYCTYPAANVRVLADGAQTPAAAAVLGYWRAVLSRLPAEDPLHRAYDSLDFVHPDSALHRYLTGAPIEAREPTAPPIFPFRRNLSQRAAVENGLTRSISVIEGPPGTGKTETILNLIANIITTDAGTVGVVSFNNAAVENVRSKLEDAGVRARGRRPRAEGETRGVLRAAGRPERPCARIRR